jgi:hypothetical protein
MPRRNRPRGGRGAWPNPAGRDRRNARLRLTRAERAFADAWVIRKEAGMVTATSRDDPSVVLTAASPREIAEAVTAYERSRITGRGGGP